MLEATPLIRDLAVILGVAGIVTLVFQKIRQPVVLGYLVAGLIIGPYTPPHILITDIPNVKALAELGVIFLMFSLGLEFSFHKLTRVGFSASITGIFEVVMMTVIGFFVGTLLNWSYYECIFLGAALAISSTTIIIKALQELNLTKKRFADVVFGILIVEDLLAILILVSLTTVVATQNIFSIAMLIAAAKLITVVTAWFLIGFFLVPYSFRIIARFTNAEILTIVSCALCLMLVVVAAHFNYSTALGAFIMGSILAETPQIARIRELIQPIRDIFAAVFFVSVGMLIDPHMILMHWPIVLLLSVITIVGKVITSGVGAYMSGQSINNSMRIGFSMAQIGEFSFIIVGLGIVMGVISDELYAMVVAVSIVTTFTTPYLIRFSNYASQQFETHVPKKTKSLLNNYSAWLYRQTSSAQNQKKYRQATTRFIVNGIIVVIIFKVIESLLLVYMTQIGKGAELRYVGIWMVSFLLASPFIWAMLTAFKLNTRKIQVTLPLAVASIATLIEIGLLSSAYLISWQVDLTLLAVLILFMSLFHKKIANFYYWFESRLIVSITSKDAKYHLLAPWDAHLVHLTMSADSPLTGRTLHDMQVRDQFGVNVVAIQRGSELYFAPRGDQVLMPGDKLIVLGDDAQIDNIRALLEVTNDNPVMDIFDNVKLKSMVIHKNAPYLHRTIRDSKIREHVNGIVVGLERNGVQIMNPDPAKTTLEVGDLLFILVR